MLFSNTDTAYFAHSYGLRDRPFVVPKDSSLHGLQSQAQEVVQYLLRISDGHIIFGANIASLTAVILTKIRSNKVCFGRHELKWNEKLFEKQVIMDDNFTFSNRFFAENAPKKPTIAPIKSKWCIEKPNADFRWSQVYYTSRISRLTGEPQMTSIRYRQLKATFPDLVIIVDYAQTIGALIADVSQECDIALWLSSKFIGANPHLWFAWISPNMVQKYPQLGELTSLARPDYIVDYAGLVHHVTNIQKCNNLADHIKDCRENIFDILGSHDIAPIVPSGQPDHFITFSVGDKEKTNIFQKGTELKGILLTSTLWNWSFDESWVPPMIRMGINYETTESDIISFKESISNYPAKL